MLLRFFQQHALAALTASVLLGLGARAVMRLIAWLSGLPGAFSAGGSFEVVLFGLLLGFPAAFVFLALRARLRTTQPWPGLLFGAGLFLLLAMFPPGSAQSAMAGTPDPPVATALLFLGLFALFGWLLELHWRRYQARRR